MAGEAPFSYRTRATALESMQAQPVDLRVQMAPESILHSALLLFGSTIVAAAAAFAAFLWWMARRGRHSEQAELVR